MESISNIKINLIASISDPKKLTARYTINANQTTNYTNWKRKITSSKRMTEREVLNLIKLKKDRLTLAQENKAEFTEKLGVRGYEEFINSELEDLKLLLELQKKLSNAKDKD